MSLAAPPVIHLTISKVDGGRQRYCFALFLESGRPSVQIDRRALLAYGAVLPLAASASRLVRAAEQVPQGQASQEKADYTLRIATGLAELAPDHIVSTT